MLFFIINIILFLQITYITWLISKLTILETKSTQRERERERGKYIFKSLLIPEKLVFFNFLVEQLIHSLPSRWSRGAIEECMCFFFLFFRGLHHRPRQCDNENQSTRANYPISKTYELCYVQFSSRASFLFSVKHTHWLWFFLDGVGSKRRRRKVVAFLKWASRAHSLLRPIYEEIWHLGLVWKKHKTL